MRNKFDFKACLCRFIYRFPFGAVFASLLLIFSFYSFNRFSFHYGDISFLPQELQSTFWHYFGISGSISVLAFILQVIIYCCIIYLLHIIPSTMLARLPINIKLFRLLILLAAALLQTVSWFCHESRLSSMFGSAHWTSFFLPFNLVVIALLLALLLVRLLGHLFRKQSQT